MYRFGPEAPQAQLWAQASPSRAVDQQLSELMQQANVLLYGLHMGIQIAGQVLKEVQWFGQLQV